MNTPQAPQKYTARLEDVQHLNEKYMHMFFELVEPHRLQFLAGQYTSIKVAEDGTRRSYSICSRPDIEHGFELLVELVPNGKGSTYLGGLKPGDEIEVLAPMGQFIINPQVNEDSLVFVATGSGIAPIYSMLQDQLQVKQDSRPMVLYWGMRYAKHLFWTTELEELVEAFPNLSFYPILSKPHSEWELSKGRVTDLVRVHNLSAEAGYYICGNNQMITDVMDILSHKQVAPERMHHEKFY